MAAKKKSPKKPQVNTKVVDSRVAKLTKEYKTLEAKALGLSKQTAFERHKAGLVLIQIAKLTPFAPWCKKHKIDLSTAKQTRRLAERISANAIKGLTITEALHKANVVQPKRKKEPKPQSEPEPIAEGVDSTPATTEANGTTAVSFAEPKDAIAPAEDAAAATSSAIARRMGDAMDALAKAHNGESDDAVDHPTASGVMHWLLALEENIQSMLAEINESPEQFVMPIELRGPVCQKWEEVELQLHEAAARFLDAAEGGKPTAKKPVKKSPKKPANRVKHLVKEGNPVS